MPVFTPADVTAVLNDLLESFDTRVFTDGPPRPSTIEGELTQGTSHTTTSSGQALVGEAFQIAPVHIPNAGDGANARHSYKSELVLVRYPDVGTKKILWWYDKDPRATPHNHPWDFRSAILSGGYTEERFWLDKDGKLQTETCTYTAGDVNVMPANMFHNVVKVEKNTVTYLDCGQARKGNEWGYLDVEKLVYKTFKELTPGNFLETFQALNPHLIKKS